MRVLKMAFMVSALVSTAACGGNDDRVRADDLSWLDTLDLNSVATTPAVISPLEMGMVHAPHLDETPAPVAVVAEEADAPRPSPARASSSRRSSSGSTASRSSGSSSGSGSTGVYRAPTPQPRVETVKHTKRDAAIGAGAGAVIGAVAGGPRNRGKGAVIGAALGGITGAVIGNNVDKSTRVVYD